MRKKGSNTDKNCWKLKVINQNQVIFGGEYKTLREVANECGFTYNQIVEISSGRKKQKLGRFDTKYELIKIVGKLNNTEEEPKEESEVLSSEEEDLNSDKSL